MYKLCVNARFSAAHRLLDYPGVCKRIHGHNYRVKAVIQSKELDKMGMVMDLMDLQTKLNNITNDFDHKVINDIPPFDELNPTSENLARFIFGELKKKLGRDIALKSIEIFETEDYSVIYSE
jgi:6-pyruvoyltetrahydropterin/6-carboxytetrahydropterin synthase